jgi:hypothetical protein
MKASTPLSSSFLLLSLFIALGLLRLFRLFRKKEERCDLISSLSIGISPLVSSRAVIPLVELQADYNPPPFAATPHARSAISFPPRPTYVIADFSF